MYTEPSVPGRKLEREPKESGSERESQGREENQQQQSEFPHSSKGTFQQQTEGPLPGRPKYPACTLNERQEQRIPSQDRGKKQSKALQRERAQPACTFSNAVCRLRSRMSSCSWNAPSLPVSLALRLSCTLGLARVKLHSSTSSFNHVPKTKRRSNIVALHQNLQKRAQQENHQKVTVIRIRKLLTKHSSKNWQRGLYHEVLLNRLGHLQ